MKATEAAEDAITSANEANETATNANNETDKVMAVAKILYQSFD